MASRDDRARQRVIERLCGAAHRDFDGLTRSELARAADSNNYSRGCVDVDRMITDGDIEPHPAKPRRYRLTLRTIDEVAYNDHFHLVSDLFNLDKPYARELRRQRIALNGDDVLMPPPPHRRFKGIGDEPKFPRYNLDPWGKLSPEEVRVAVAARDGSTFWTESIPAGRTALITGLPQPLAEIEVPAQDFAWTPQVHTTGPHNVTVMVGPVTIADVDPSPHDASESFWT